MRTRFVYPTVTANGLGNNIITLAKAYLIAQSCSLDYRHPIWPPCEHVKPATPNGYGHYFPIKAADNLKLRLTEYQFRIQRKLGFQLWPTVYFKREDYARTGVMDAGEACLSYLKELGLDDPDKSLVVTTSGMWGGYAAIKRAKEWMGQLFMSHSDTRRRINDIEQRTAGRLRVAVQIRMGDFAPREALGPIQEGERVVRLPLDWYARICRLIRELCDCEFILVTDGTRNELADFLEEFNPISTIDEPYRDLLGALIMGRADLVVCSNSTYSRMGVFLNDKPYIWPSDALIKDSSGRFGYLWKEGGKPVLNGHGMNKEAVRRCFALSMDFTSFPVGLNRYLQSGCNIPVEITDDLLYSEPVALL